MEAKSKVSDVPEETDENAEDIDDQDTVDDDVEDTVDANADDTNDADIEDTVDDHFDVPNIAWIEAEIIPCTKDYFASYKNEETDPVKKEEARDKITKMSCMKYPFQI